MQYFAVLFRRDAAAKLTADDPDIFSGAFWSAKGAMGLGLIDGIGDMRTRMRELYGAKVELRAVASC